MCCIPMMICVWCVWGEHLKCIRSPGPICRVALHMCLCVMWCLCVCVREQRYTIHSSQSAQIISQLSIYMFLSVCVCGERCIAGDSASIVIIIFSMLLQRSEAALGLLHTFNSCSLGTRYDAPVLSNAKYGHVCPSARPPVRSYTISSPCPCTVWPCAAALQQRQFSMGLAAQKQKSHIENLITIDSSSHTM